MTTAGSASIWGETESRQTIKATPTLGPNELQNAPVIVLAQPGSTTRVGGVLHSSRGSFTIDFYANSDPDPTGHGEGERWLGSRTVNTDVSGNAYFEFDLGAATSSSEWITATATQGGTGHTSEFSAARQANDEGNVLVVMNTNRTRSRIAGEPDQPGQLDCR